jgi:putative inorganic carbon (hco3(-)) transporter
MEWLVTLLIVAPAGFFYLTGSTWLIDYLIWVTVLNRGIRRYVDWLAGDFNPLSPISLTPLLISGFVFLMVLQNFKAFPPKLTRIFYFFAIALTLGLGVGIIRNGFASIYALAEYIAPLSVLGCAALLKGNEQILDRWVKTVGWAAVAASAYGWYQYYTIPPWDAFWVREVGFEGYLGQLRPTEMTVFSTMGERGVLGGYLGFAVIPMIISKRWRNITGWFSIVLILSVILLTFVRSAIIAIGFATLTFPVLNRGKNTLQILAVICVIGVAGNFFLKRSESSDRISQRLQTLQTITEDGSFKGRIDIANYGVMSILKNPIGLGLGSTGLGGRINTGGAASEGGGIGDNGYLEIFFSFGIVGGACFFYALYLIWQQVRMMDRAGIQNESLMMFKTFFLTGAVALLASNWFGSPAALVFCLFCGFAAYPKAIVDRFVQARRTVAENSGPSRLPRST